MIKIAYIGNRGFHSDNVNGATRGDNRFIACAVAGGTKDEDMKSFYEYIKIDHPSVKLYSDYIEMLNAENPDVAVVSPQFNLTARICIECAKRGIHVFAEKPVAINLDELHLLKDAVQKSNIHFMAMHFLRFNGVFYQAIKAVKNGLIGDVRMINAQKSYKLGKRADFFKKRETYGGTIPWVGIHGIDWIYTIAGRRCKKITANHSCIGNANHGELESSCLCHFVFEDDIFASLAIDYIRPEKAPTHSDDRLRVVGTKGVLYTQGNSLTLINDECTHNIDVTEEKNLVMEFLESVLADSVCESITSEEIFEITKLSLLARQSADSNETISL